MLNESITLFSIVFFLGVSILFYCLFAGADFGAGILECFLGKNYCAQQKELITHAMGPVWEANHMWLILAVVILFNGFPKAYAALSTQFHIPLTLMLFGIILRGCAFTFRHYDAIRDRSQTVYSFIFKISSVLTPLMFGMIAGAILLGQKIQPNGPFFETYVSPWFNLFSFSVGGFCCVLFAFLAAVYLVGETDQASIKSIFVQRAMAFNLLAVLTGGAVFLAAEYAGLPLMHSFSTEPLSLACVGLNTLILLPLWLCLMHDQVWPARILAGAQIGLILIAWFKIQFPTLVGSLTIYNSAAPAPVLVYLLYALVLGSLIIFPALFYLMKIFKSTGSAPKAR